MFKVLSLLVRCASIVVVLGAAACSSEDQLTKSVGDAKWERSASGSYSQVTILFATDRQFQLGKEPSFRFAGLRNESSNRMTYGTATVAIPRDHRMAEIESPRWWKLQLHQDAGRYVTVLELTTVSQSSFYRSVSTMSEDAEDGHALLYIHGFNVPFDDAVKRLAQISYDLGFHGASILYSWPSRGEPSEYLMDENSIDWSSTQFNKFLQDLIRIRHLKRLTILAHSMGNRLLEDGLRVTLEPQNQPYSDKIKDIIFAAPDIDRLTFCDKIIPLLSRMKSTATLYASSNDWALEISKRAHGTRRAGDTTGGVLVSGSVTTIDASEVDTGLIGHSYYGDSKTVMSDVFQMLRGIHPESRSNLIPGNKHIEECSTGGSYWTIKSPTN